MRNILLNKKAPRANFSQVGFTLVELLIVIVIIGILAGVVIGVLNPVQQQNRARDAGLRAQLDKMALSTKSLYASSPRTTNRAPTTNEFANGLANWVTSGDAGAVDCKTGASANDAAATITCHFGLGSATSTPSTCAGLYNGDGAVHCNYAYYRTPASFILAVKGWAQPANMFVYMYAETAATGVVTENFYSCPVTYAVGGATTGCVSLN